MLSSLLDAAYFGGEKVAGGGSVTFHGSFTTTGTFKSINNVALSGKPFSGSWNCHGAFAKH